MNVELLTKVAEWLEAGAPHTVTPLGDIAGFNMNWVQREIDEDYRPEFMTEFLNTPYACGTVCCIAGYAAGLNGDRIDTEDFVEYASHAFDLSRTEANRLCNPFYEVKDLEKVSPAQAARVIRHLIKTGEVVW